MIELSAMEKRLAHEAEEPPQQARLLNIRLPQSMANEVCCVCRHLSCRGGMGRMGGMSGAAGRLGFGHPLFA